MISAMVWNQQILFRLLCLAIINRVAQKADTDVLGYTGIIYQYSETRTSTTKCQGWAILLHYLSVIC